MTTHLRARMAQAGALLAVVIGGIAVAPAVALAQPPTVRITSLPIDVQSGRVVTMQYRVADNNGDQVASADIVISGELNCTGGECSQRADVTRQGRQFTAQLTAPTVDPGKTRQVQVTVTATIGRDDVGTDSVTVTVRGPAQAQTVRQVTGKIKDQDGKAVAGAAVGIADSAGHKYPATTNGSGGFSFTSTDANPIAPGNILVLAGKSGYKDTQVTVQGEVGRTVNVPLVLTLIAAAASPTPTESASPEASDEPTVADTTPADEQTTAVDPANAANQDGGMSWLYIIIGILLVAAGAGAIVLVFMRRRHGDGDDEDGGDPPTTFLNGPGGVVPPTQGRFNDATRVAAPIGAGMMAPRSGAPSMSDAPTMLHRPVPVEDEFPDPYGVPLPQPGGYAGGAPGWDNQNYDQPNQYGAPQADAGYGYGGGANYGAAPQQQYDEPTGLYQPEVDDAGYGGYDRGDYAGGTDQPYGGGGYGAAPAAPGASAYGAGPAAGGAQPYGGGYAASPEQANYGGWGAPAGDVDSGGAAYGPRAGGESYGPSSGSAYGAGGQQQYGGGHDQGGYGGYDQAGGGDYDQGAPADQPDYQHGSTYGEQTSRHGGQPRPEPLHPSQRRSREWDS